MRSARGCTLHGVEPVERKPKAAKLYQITHATPYMGRYPDQSLAGTLVLGVPQKVETPYEPPENGCPGAWYRSPFIDSLFPYMRRRTSDGGRVQNPRFDSAHWQTQNAILEFETEEERAHAYAQQVSADFAAQMNAPDETPPARGPMARVRGRR